MVLIQPLLQTKNDTIQPTTLDTVMKIKDKEIIVYLARDDCPKCKETDKYLHDNEKKLPTIIYRIETRKEPNKKLLDQLIRQQNIKKVPTFITKKNDKITKVQLKQEQNKIAFQRLNED